MSIESELSLKILNVYKRTIFAKVSKLEIDLVVFAMLVKEIFSKNNFNCFSLDSRHIRQLSFQLKIKESRVSNLIEQAALMEIKQEQIENLIFD